MEKMTRRKLQALDTKSRIFNSASRLMEQKGFDNITIEQISKDANVSVGAFYHHYLSKNDILNEIYQQGDDYFRERVVNQLSGVTTAELIVSYFDHFAQFYISLGVDHIKALYKTQSKIFVNKNRYMITALRDIITQGQAKKELACDMSADEITDMLVSTARGFAYTWCLYDGDYPFQEVMHRSIDCLAKSLTY